MVELWLIAEGRVGAGHSVTLRKAISSLLVDLSEAGTLRSFYGPRTFGRGTRFLVAVSGVDCGSLTEIEARLKAALSGCTELEELAFFYAGRAVGVEVC